MQRKILQRLVLFTLPIIVTACARTSPEATPESVGFDLDDTILFTTPAFQKGFETDIEPFSEKFWRFVNGATPENSCVKPRIYKLLQKHKQNGAKIYVITAREGHGGEPVRKYVSKTFGIPADHVFFEPEEKTTRMKKLNIELFYGDSNSDITDARKANAKAIRVQRSDKSGYDKKYDPGTYDEKILPNSTGHDCGFDPSS